MQSQDFQQIRFSINELSISSNNNYDSSIGKDWELPGIEMVASLFGQEEYISDNELGVLLLIHFEWEEEQYTPLTGINVFALSVFHFDEKLSAEQILKYPLAPMCQRMYEMVAGIIAMQTASASYGQYIMPSLNVADYLNRMDVELAKSPIEPGIMTAHFPGKGTSNSIK